MPGAPVPQLLARPRPTSCISTYPDRRDYTTRRWPHTPLSASERESHAALAALSARTAELRTGVAQLGSFAHEPPPANGSSVDENEATEAALELRRQGRVLERLIAQVREARERVDEVLA